MTDYSDAAAQLRRAGNALKTSANELDELSGTSPPPMGEDGLRWVAGDGSAEFTTIRDAVLSLPVASGVGHHGTIHVADRGVIRETAPIPVGAWLAIHGENTTPYGYGSHVQRMGAGPLFDFDPNVHPHHFLLRDLVLDGMSADVLGSWANSDVSDLMTVRRGGFNFTIDNVEFLNLPRHGLVVNGVPLNVDIRSLTARDSIGSALFLDLGGEGWTGMLTYVGGQFDNVGSGTAPIRIVDGRGPSSDLAEASLMFYGLKNEAWPKDWMPDGIARHLIHYTSETSAPPIGIAVYGAVTRSMPADLPASWMLYEDGSGTPAEWSLDQVANDDHCAGIFRSEITGLEYGAGRGQRVRFLAP